MMMKELRIIIAVLLILVIFATGVFTGSQIAIELPPAGSDYKSIPQLSTEGFVIVENIDAGLNEIYLTSGCFKLPMAIDEQQILSILIGSSGERGFRPLTHDLMTDVFEIYDIKILMVKIESIFDGTYFAKILLKRGGKVLNLDSRPSDAIAIAARTNAPVYINKTLLEEYGDNIC